MATPPATTATTTTTATATATTEPGFAPPPSPPAASRRDRQRHEHRAELYAILVATEMLERAYIRDAISAAEYAPVCTSLIAQYHAAHALVATEHAGAAPFDVDAFMRELRMECAVARHRLMVARVPATEEHQSRAEAAGAAAGGATLSAKRVAETIQQFITLMDALKLNLVAVDHVHPLLADLAQSLVYAVSVTRAQQGAGADALGAAADKVREWLIDVNRMRASDELSSAQVRQLLFDLERAHAAFYRSLPEGGGAEA